MNTRNKPNKIKKARKLKKSKEYHYQNNKKHFKLNFNNNLKN